MKKITAGKYETEKHWISREMAIYSNRWAWILYSKDGSTKPKEFRTLTQIKFYLKESA